MKAKAGKPTQEEKDHRLIESARRLAREITSSGIPDDLEDGELAWMLETLAGQMYYYMHNARSAPTCAAVEEKAK